MGGIASPDCDRINRRCVAAFRLRALPFRLSKRGEIGGMGRSPPARLGGRDDYGFRMPTNYLAPNVYVEEVSWGNPVIEALPTGVTAFVGAATKGTSYRAAEIKSLAQFTARFGALKSNLELGYAISQFFSNGGMSAWVVRLPQKATVENWARAFRALDRVESFDLLVLPGMESATVSAEALAYAQSRRAFLLLDAPRAALTVAGMHRAEATLPVSADAAIYFPWISISDPAKAGASRLTAPAATVAGVMARTDARRGVWKAAAGTEAVINGTNGLAVAVNDRENEELNGLAVNCLREFPGKGRLVFGARTRAGANASGSEWKYISVRRLALFIERSVDRGLRWVVFEPNDEPLWTRIRSSVENFLTGLFRAGAFQGTSAKEAFFVKCDRTTMTAADISNGIAIVQIGIAPLKPAEFVILKLSLKTRA